MPRRELSGAASHARLRLRRGLRIAGPEGVQVRDLIALCAVPRKCDEKFLRPLAHAGYLRAERGGPARRYFLVRDTGPLPPRVSRRVRSCWT